MTRPRFTQAVLAVPVLVCAVVFPACAAQPAPDAEHAANAWYATKMIDAREVLSADSIELKPLAAPQMGVFNPEESPAGLEARHRIMAGQPLLDRDLRRHPVVRANSQVRVVWDAGAIHMQLEARALQDGAPGDTIRVLNPSSSRTLYGVVMPDGSVQAGGGGS